MMKPLLLFILLLITAGNLFGQTEKPKEKPQEKPNEKVEETPPPVLLEVEEVWPEDYFEGVDEMLIEAPAPPVREKHTGDDPYSYVEQMPTFPGGTEAMYKFIYENIKYPELAKQKGISGQVILQYVVSSDGTITRGKILRGIGGGCEEEALRVLNAMPKWNPGIHNGQAVSVLFTLPIKFVNQ